MRVICPNCDRRGLIYAESPSDLPPRAVCPRCAAPFRAVPSGFEPATVATAAQHAPASTHAFITERAPASHVAAPRAFIVNPLRATTRDEEEDVLALPRMDAGDDARDDSREDGAGVVLDLDGRLFAREPQARPRDASDNYRRAVRLMNVSPLWMLAACAGFFALVFVFDLLLTPAPRANGEATALASVSNEATNRDTARRARASDADQSEEPAAQEARRETDDARIGDDEGSSADADAHADRNELKRAPVSDAATDLVETPARAAEVSFAHASEKLRVDAGVEAQPMTFAIQLGSFRVAAEAEAQAGTLRDAGFDARVVEQQNSKRPWYCVQTGLFGGREEAAQRLSELRAKGFAASYTLKEIR
jgi:cell division protein FtsN